ncbi:hypothetical protein ABZ832_17115 [Streptantibioticus parmotrematis]|uniref:hypothetical protein n=1 Tax=Streptantibioticus parmotrematis TaxID=2873249 RepID=UPI0033D60280
MTIHQLCKDPESPNNGSPTLYYDDEADTFLFQSWKIQDARRISGISIPEHETIIEFPKRLLGLFPQLKDGEYYSCDGVLVQAIAPVEQGNDG